MVEPKSVVTGAFSVDVEEAFQVSAFTPYIERDTWESLESRVASATCRLLSILEDNSTKATFFVLGWIAQRHPSLLRTIAEQGHEIACHGWDHRPLFELAVDEFREQTLRAKETLEEITGRQIVGYRAASFSIRKDTLWAVEVLQQCGFTYDSSIFPIRHDLYGIPDAELDPHRIPGSDLIEIPMSVALVSGLRVPVGGGGYFRLYPYSMSRSLMRRVQRQGRPVVFYVHPWEIDPGQPLVPADRVTTIRHYTNLHRTEHRLESVLREFRFGTMGDLAESVRGDMRNRTRKANG